MLVECVVTKAPATAADPVGIAEAVLGGGGQQLGLTPWWMPRSTTIPQVGDLCMVDQTASGVRVIVSWRRSSELPS